MQNSKERENRLENAPSRLLQRAARLVARSVDQKLRKLDLSASQLVVIAALEAGSLSQKELARVAEVEPPTMAELLARMELQKLVRRAPDPHDKRKIVVSLGPPSASNATKAAKANDALAIAEEAAFHDLSKKEAKMLAKLLKKVIANLEAERTGERASS